MRLSKYIILFTLPLCLTSCIEQLEWKHGESASGRLVVEGSITTERKAHQVLLSRTQPAIVEELPEPVSNAVVTIDDGNVTFELNEISPGRYVTADTVMGKVGNIYHLIIQLDNEQFEAYAELQKSEPVEPITISKWDINLPQATEYDYFQFLFRDNFGSPMPYKYEVITEIDPDIKNHYPSTWTAPQWIQFILDRYQSTNDPVVSDSIYYLHPGLEPPAIFAYGESNEARLAYGSKVTEKFYSMTPEHYAYVRAVLSETEWRGLGPFGYQPANVPTNISNDALGYFSASDVYIVQQVITK